MLRRALAGLAAAAAAATLTMTAAAPAHAEDWCDHDPLVKVDMPDGSKEHVHLTVGALDEAHKKALQRAEISSQAVREGSSIKVTITVIVPQDGTGAFKTRAMASTQPHGKGAVRAPYVYGEAGAAMKLTYSLPR